MGVEALGEKEEEEEEEKKDGQLMKGANVVLMMF